MEEERPRITTAPALHQPISARFGAGFESRGVRHSFAIAIPSRLACAAGASGSAAPPLRCQGCSHPSPAPPGARLPSASDRLLRQPAGESLHLARYDSASWRTVRLVDGVEHLDD